MTSSFKVILWRELAFMLDQLGPQEPKEQLLNVLVKIANITGKGLWLLTTKRLTGFWPCWMNGNGACWPVCWRCGLGMVAF